MTARFSFAFGESVRLRAIAGPPNTKPALPSAARLRKLRRLRKGQLSCAASGSRRSRSGLEFRIFFVIRHSLAAPRLDDGGSFFCRQLPYINILKPQWSAM